MSDIAERHADLPVSDVLEPLREALAQGPNAVLAAPPGAGKTTLVPLVLIEEPWLKGKIILVEPRRLAARAAARRMAAMLGEEVGGTVGYRMRLDTKVTARTRIEVVTEGVFTRMALSSPDLEGIDCVIFDEFHERALEADFGLALALDIQSGLREDLRILVMSATLDTARVAGLIEDCPVIESLGRSHPVDIRYLDRPAGQRIDIAMASAIEMVCRTEAGSILAFLPGQGEIRQVAARLEDRLGPLTDVQPLYGGLSSAEQDAAIRPSPEGRRKVVLSTPVAESSITIDGVRVVIDSGLVRQPVYEPSTGITRLETIRASQASADQRAGRAGRTAPGIAVRLWRAEQTKALPAFSTPQILASDLSALVLDCLAWGVSDPRRLRFIDPPPDAALEEARTLLFKLGAIDAEGGLTQRGKRMRELALPPRLASMVVAGEEDGHGYAAAELAVLLTEQGLGGQDVDLETRLSRFRSDRTPRGSAARALVARISGGGKAARSGGVVPAAALLVHAFPDRIARQRGGRGRFVLANGRGAAIDETDRLAGAEFLVIADLSGKAQAARILAAAELSGQALEDVLDEQATQDDECIFDAQSGSVRARRIRRLGAITLAETPLPRPDAAQAMAALCAGIRKTGIKALPFSPAGLQLRDRIGFLHRSLGAPWPDVSDAALLEALETWFAPFQPGITALKAIDRDGLNEGLLSLCGHDAKAEIARLVPTHYEAPTGSRLPIRYDEESPVVAVRVQELFGETRHPAIAGGRLPLTLELLSPAHRPIQTTRDLPGFWAGSWADVRADMRGRYPRHPWPENPAEAGPTRRAKPRGT
ncbi:MAG: ATP-dependent helicase HrpB [Hoeflea sp.]|uniref:ATP-dependent helicase HrpB n=1 Tax=Hoeflea sp. TaxID=1940281 RepID=UPI001DEE05B8|nr:ATP-dependent helicase HrpB [Hoeflea sp.]MBU4531718.1 ATP-dependent helicase HrpB [Alphaproteobacteria bacterium]MBU4544574.1 ATP-dependent helicase HrpB [Alphaproteobacteria bacterium]MBU4552805.1 ATP-dependent helicase HrpB [Alphaproteobacteria bacterium]MBV1724994.1 ATP-dependent helicase HrpB [Hoeflea sp.]MBV1761014.1 ATP-dependent helicase HrpB [Hoeflea sp.]